jgi:myo-inositol catabolism protein IolC
MTPDAPMRTRTRAPEPLYMLAFDHRQVLRDLYPGATTDDLVRAKHTVLDALGALTEDVPARSLAFLVDEEYGGSAAQRARRQGLYVAMPVEASRTPSLQFQYPDDYASRFARDDPQSVKVLVFHNPDDDEDRQQAQFELLRRAGDLARDQDRDYLLEVLVTPTAEQLRECGDDRSVFRTRLFPTLLVDSIAQMHQAGIEPDLWKVEGLATVEDTAAVAAQAMSGGRDHVRCIVLGSGESPATVHQWLANASAVPGFSGFAIGRTVWHRPLAGLLAGALTREAAVEEMARSFAELVDAFGREQTAVRAGRSG